MPDLLWSIYWGEGYSLTFLIFKGILFVLIFEFKIKRFSIAVIKFIELPNLCFHVS